MQASGGHNRQEPNPCLLVVVEIYTFNQGFQINGNRSLESDAAPLSRLRLPSNFGFDRLI
jgi:hypothetical protein